MVKKQLEITHCSECSNVSIIKLKIICCHKYKMKPRKLTNYPNIPIDCPLKSVEEK